MFAKMLSEREGATPPPLPPQRNVPARPTSQTKTSVIKYGVSSLLLHQLLKDEVAVDVLDILNRWFSLSTWFHL